MIEGLDDPPKNTTDSDLNELGAIVKREIERREEEKGRMEQEMKSMQSLLQIVGSDMLAGISSNDKHFRSDSD